MERCTSTNFRSPARRAAAVSLAYLAVLGTTSALAVGSAAAAEPIAEMHKITINYRDLNLATISGATALEHRIEAAARTVCGEEARTLQEQLGFRSCYHDAVNNAVKSVNSPVLNAVHNGEKPKGLVTAQLTP